MEYFASFGTAMVPTMGLHKSVLHVLAKRYAIYPKARQNNDTLANFVSVSFFVKYSSLSNNIPPTEQI